MVLKKPFLAGNGILYKDLLLCVPPGQGTGIILAVLPIFIAFAGIYFIL